MPFNPQDPYDAAALYDMWLNCTHCPTTFDFEPSGQIDLDYYHQIGQRARHANWVVLPARESDGNPLFTVLCPACAKRVGVDTEDAVMPSHDGAIEQICKALKAASEAA